MKRCRLDALGCAVWLFWAAVAFFIAVQVYLLVTHQGHPL